MVVHSSTFIGSKSRILLYILFISNGLHKIQNIIKVCLIYYLLFCLVESSNFNAK